MSRHQTANGVGRDIVVIGASAGGVQALQELMRGLPGDYAGSVFVVVHTSASSPGILPQILDRAGLLPAAHAEDREKIRPGHIYVAPPDYHLVIEDGHVLVTRGPKENGFRPAVDVLFRTAARSYGPRVVGVVLTGMLDDGTAGLLAIKRRGGVAIVQAPADAVFPSMPESAMRYVDVDAALELSDIPQMLARLAHERVEPESEAPMPEDLEADISELDREALERSSSLGTPVPFSCPDCGGVLAEFYDGDMLRFRCQVGHAYSPESLLACQAETTDRSVWAAYRALDERAELAKWLTRDARRFNDRAGERRFAQLIEQAEAQKERIREAMLKDENSSEF